MPTIATTAWTASRRARPAPSTTGASSQRPIRWTSSSVGPTCRRKQDFAANAEADASSKRSTTNRALLAEAHGGAGGKAVAPRSATKPTVNLYTAAKPAEATVQGNFRLTADGADSDVRHIILDFGDQPFPVLEGQSIGIVPPGADADGKPHLLRLYSDRQPARRRAAELQQSVADGEARARRRRSNYVCDLKQGDKVEVTGPFGATFLMPNDPQARLS